MSKRIAHLSIFIHCTRTRTNLSGGVQGGISNGENIVLRVSFKPTATIGREQKTVTRDGNKCFEIELINFK